MSVRSERWTTAWDTLDKLVANAHKVSNLTKASLLIYNASIGQGSLQPLDAFVRNVGFVDVELFEVLHVCQQGNGPVGNLLNHT